MSHHSNGNVLFLVLIAVALFAALSYAITSSTRSSGGDISKEKMELAFDAIQNTIAAHRMAANLMASRGIDIGTLDANSGSIGGTVLYGSTNPSCTSDACRIYKPAGGAITYFNFYSLYPQFSASAGLANKDGLFFSPWYAQGTPVPNNRPDLILNIWVTQDFCKFYNDRLGLGYTTGVATNPLAMHALSANPAVSLDASYAASNAGWSGLGQGPHLNFGLDGCIDHAGTGFKVISMIYAR